MSIANVARTEAEKRYEGIYGSDYDPNPERRAYEKGYADGASRKVEVTDRGLAEAMRGHLDTIRGAQTDMLNRRPEMDALEEIAISLRRMEETVDAALGAALTEPN